MKYQSVILYYREESWRQRFLCDSIIRLIPGVLGDESSALTDSYQDGLLAPPIYTRPANYKGLGGSSPTNLGQYTSGRKMGGKTRPLKKTKEIRPDLLKDQD